MSYALPKPRVLVVEDERIVALHLRQLLLKLGYQVVAVAASGDEALQRIEHLRPDLVLMDIHLDGDLDGIDTVQRIPADSRSSVVYLTAHSEQTTIDRARATRPYGYVLKPVSEQELHITLTMVLERRQSEFALQESEERLRLALEAAAMGSWEFDHISGIFECEGLADELFGFTETHEPRSLDSLLRRIPPADRPNVNRILREELTDKSLRRVEFRVQDPRGGERQLTIEASLCPAADGRERMIGVVQDVTERHDRDAELQRRTTELGSEVQHRRATEVALRESEEAFRNLFQNNPLPMSVLDNSGLKFLAINDASVNSYGYSREEFLAMSATDLVLPSNVPAMLRRLEVATAGYVYFPNVRHRRKDGEIIQVDIFRREIIFEGTRAYIAASIDVTQRNLIEERLRQSQKMEAVGQLTGGVAHDFNNLLAIIYGNLELISEEESTTPAVQEMVRDALGAAKRGAILTNRLLSFSRRQQLAPAMVDLGKIISELLTMLPRVLEESIQIETSIPPGLWKTLIDPAQLDNALINLAVNARDAMPGGGTITIEAQNVVLDEAYASQHDDVSAGPYVMLAVSDTGTGMPPEVVERALEPFFTTKGLGRGTGLGLSMVYGFVKQSGGHLKIYSEQGRGTTIKLYLPRARSEDDTADAAPEAAKDPRAKPGEVILLIEDEPSVRRLTVRFLVDLGYRIIEAGDGPGALELLGRTQKIDLLLTDVVLPHGMSGPEISQEARKKRPALGVVFMTGYAPEGVLRLEEIEGARMLSKPFSKSELAVMLRQTLDLQPQGATQQRLLIVDDEPEFANFVARVAADMGYAVEITTRPREFLDAFDRERPDAIIMDIIMPEQDGIELIQWLADREYDARVIVVTGGAPLYAMMAEEIGRRKGTFELTTLIKPFPPDVLRAALQ